MTMMAHRSLLRSLAGVLPLSALATADAPTCRYLPGDAGWPTQTEWATLNGTVGGRLIPTVPQAHVCHIQPYRNYNEGECAALRTTWGEAQTFSVKPAEIINTYYQNQSCDPFTPTSTPCELGNYVVYSINVTGVDDVLAGIQFAKEKNVRLAIKTTGHDYMGKSTGKGALALWMYDLKSTEIITQYESAQYSGAAIKVGAGVIVGDVYAAVSQAGYRIVGGDCGSVGFAGGYSQGGGHSILNSAYGMAADNVLEWEVVTASGEHLIATPSQNSDLYWALGGGGGGTYGVVLSLTVKLYPDGPVANGLLTFNDTSVGNDIFWQGVALWYQYLPSFIKDKNVFQFLVMNNTFGVLSMTLPDQNASAVEPLLAPYLAELDSLNITYTTGSDVSSTYLEHFAKFYGPLPYGPEPPSTILSSRLIPRDTVLSTDANNKFVDSLRSTVESGTFYVGCSGMDVSSDNHPDNAVLPAWRDAIAICNVNSNWNYTAPLAQNIAVKEELVDIHFPAIEAATPGSGVYLNEMDPLYKGDWKQTMYGANYDRLLQIKHTYDPDYLLYGHFAVGGDEFVIDGSGRLCRA